MVIFAHRSQDTKQQVSLCVQKEVLISPGYE